MGEYGYENRIPYEKVLQEMKYGNSTIQIVEMTKLIGAKNNYMAQNLFFLEQAGVHEKFIRVILNNDSVTTEAGAFYYSKGNIKNNVNIGGVGGLVGKAVKSKLTGEKAFNPVYSGTGIVVLEPTFGYYVLYPMDNESIIVDKSLYYCHLGDINVKPVMQQNLSAGFAGGEGWFQTQITGSGIVALEIPVPLEELVVYNLQNERCQVDGNFAILRSSSINFSVTKSTKGIVGTMASGEGLLNTFEGSGELWLAPTAPVYNKLSFGGISSVTSGNMNNRQ